MSESQGRVSVPLKCTGCSTISMQSYWKCSFCEQIYENFALCDVCYEKTKSHVTLTHLMYSVKI